MEIIGDPEIFAVQIELDDSEPTYRPWMYGVFCVFICGKLLGSPQNQATLNSILAMMNVWKETIGCRCDPALMQEDGWTAYLSIELDRYGLDHMKDAIPEHFCPISVKQKGYFQILDVDGLERYRIYCVEDDITSRLLYTEDYTFFHECRVPRAVLTDVLERTIERLDEWFRALPYPPPS